MSNDTDADDLDETVDPETNDDATKAEEPESGLQQGDFIELDYTARTTEDDLLVDTTDPDVAEEEGVDEEQEFAPRTVVLGQNHIFPDVEDDIYGKEAGEDGSVTVPAEDAFGAYDESQVRTVSKDKIAEDDRYPGAHVDVDGEHGHIETIIGGRARVDFNHVLAGKDIEYEYEILGEVDDREERAQGILSTMIDTDLNVWFQTDTVEEERPVESDDSEGESDAQPDDETATQSDDETEMSADGEMETPADDETETPADDETEMSADDDVETEPTYETVDVEKDTLYIEATPQLTMNQQWMMGKMQISQQLIDLLDIDRVVVQEELDGFGGMGGLGGLGGAGGPDIEAALDDADVDADELMDEIEGAAE